MLDNSLIGQTGVLNIFNGGLQERVIFQFFILIYMWAGL